MERIYLEEILKLVLEINSTTEFNSGLSLYGDSNRITVYVDNGKPFFDVDRSLLCEVGASVARVEELAEVVTVLKNFIEAKVRTVYRFSCFFDENFISKTFENKSDADGMKEQFKGYPGFLKLKVEPIQKREVLNEN